MGQVFLEDMSPEKRKKYLEERAKKLQQTKQKEEAASQVESKKYRCEQTTVAKSNGVILSHGNTKREFIVKKITKEGQLFCKVEMVDNIITMVPNELTEAAKLLNEFENVKSPVIVSVDNESGTINNVANHKEIVDRWFVYKNELFNRYSFLRTETNKNTRDNYIDLSERVITETKSLIRDLQTKMFFDLFFGKYLVSKENLFNPYKRIFNSQLFEGVEVELDFKQEVMRESPDMFLVKKTGRLNKNYNENKIRDIYDQKYKPQIQYKFSEFDFMMIENTVMNTNGSYWIEQSDVSMAERVKNNIELFIDYKLRQIE